MILGGGLAGVIGLNNVFYITGLFLSFGGIVALRLTEE